MLEQAYLELNKNAAAGVDSVTYEEDGICIRNWSTWRNG
jgi:hypothetical protein